MQILLNCAFAKNRVKKKKTERIQVGFMSSRNEKVSRDWGPDKTAQWKCWRGEE